MRIFRSETDCVKWIFGIDMPPKLGSTGTIIIDHAKGTVQKRPTLYQQFKVLEREIRWLKILCDCDFVPDYLASDDENIWMVYVGEPITKENCPKNWKEQFEDIVDTLDKYQCVHNDLKDKDVLVYNSRIYLVDFQWATETGEEIPKDWPKHLCGYQGNRKALENILRKYGQN